MEFKEILSRRRSVRKFSDRTVPGDLVDGMLAAALSAPSARNTRSTHFLVVDDPAMVARMAAARDYGAGFLAGAPLAIVVLGEPSKSDLWRENGAIAATILQLAVVDAGLVSCWVHIDGRPRSKENPQAGSAAELLRELLPIPKGCEPLCVLALGFSDFIPAPLPEADDWARVIRLK